MPPKKNKKAKQAEQTPTQEESPDLVPQADSRDTRIEAQLESAYAEVRQEDNDESTAATSFNAH